MSKGDKPRSDAKKAKVAKRDEPTSHTGGGDGGAGSSKPNQPCWSFALVNVTPAGRKAKKGESVQGAAPRSVVVVLGKGALGDAPSRESNEMIAAVNRTGGRLAGTVIAEDKTGANVKVQLCIS
jgi:hypothetical protein